MDFNTKLNRLSVPHEWSWIFTLGLGKAYGQHILGNKEIKISTFPEAYPFFYFLPKKNILEAKTLRYGVASWGVYEKDFNPKRRWGDEWTPPPLKEHYKGKIISNKPIITINNKYNPEWGPQIPFNYLSLDFIESFIKEFSDQYQIIYIRHDKKFKQEGYYDDVLGLDLGDYKLLESYPQVKTIYDIMETKKIGFNLAQLEILAASKQVISVNGGSACLSAYFGEDVMIYGAKDCKSTSRGIWKTDSWLKELSGANILGFLDEKKLIETAKQRWL